MQYIYGTADLTRHKESVVVLGNFDGVHQGHQQLFQVAKEEAKRRGLETVVLSFYPHPTWVIGSHKKPLIMARREKKQMIEHLGMDVLVEYPFTKTFSNISPTEFFVSLLVRQLKARAVVVGSNYFFGKAQTGSTAVLQTLGKQYGIKVCVVEAVMINKQMISSTKIRNLIQDGQIEDANEMLGHPYTIMGEVMSGKKLGRTIGYPTLNLVADPTRVYPPNGVYATKVKVYDKTYLGMTNIGFNPTVSGECKMIETHLFDFNQSIYGEIVTIDFYHYIRPEQKFESIEALQAQLMCDQQSVQDFFNKQ